MLDIVEVFLVVTLAAEALKRPALWRQPRRAVTVGSGHEHLDVPAFLRRQSE